jgi:hypothetical protein
MWITQSWSLGVGNMHLSQESGNHYSLSVQ